MYNKQCLLCAIQAVKHIGVDCPHAQRSEYIGSHALTFVASSVFCFDLGMNIFLL